MPRAHKQEGFDLIQSQRNNQHGLRTKAMSKNSRGSTGAQVQNIKTGRLMNVISYSYQCYSQFSHIFYCNKHLYKY